MSRRRSAAILGLLILLLSTSCTAGSSELAGQACGSGRLPGVGLTPVRLLLDNGWELQLPSSFARIENADGSVQAADGARVIYLSALTIRPRDSAPIPPASELHRNMTKLTESGAYELGGPICWGHAQFVTKGTNDLELKATREADGTVLTCVISFRDRQDLDWALGVWKAIRAPTGG